MQSKMLLGVLSALFAMALLFTLAVPKRPVPGERGTTQPTAPTTGEPARVAAVPPVAEPPAAEELVAGTWQPAGFDVGLPAPEGWVPSRRRSRAYLHKDPTRPLQGNFSLIRLPNIYGRSLEGLLQENRAELEANPQFELESIEMVELAGAPRIRVDYIGTPSGGDPVRFAGLIWLRGSEQIVLTFTVDADLWAERGPDAERCLQGLTVASAPAAEVPAGTADTTSH